MRQKSQRIRRPAGTLNLDRLFTQERLRTMATGTFSETTTAIDTSETLNSIVARFPSTLAVLQRFGLDTCCGGALPLRVAAEHHGLDIDTLREALRDAA